MQRRQLLQMLGASAALLPLAGWANTTDPLAANHSGFAAARRQYPLLAGWETVPPPGTAPVQAKLEGRWPAELDGVLYRNGPGLWDRDGQRYQHWFDGDGLVQRWAVSGGKVQHRSRFVETEKFAVEQKAGRFTRMAAGTRIPEAQAISGPDDLNTANISMLNIGGKLYALWEAGSAIQIDPEQLQTLGAHAWSEELKGVPFSAHPLLEADGSLWNYGQFGTRLVIYRIGADGALKQFQIIELPRGGYLHSFAQTASKLVFVLAPLVMSEFQGSFFESLQWRPELGSLAVVVHKNALDAAPQLHELEAGMAYHYADAWDHADGSLSLRACWYADGGTASSPFAGFMRGDMRPPAALRSDLVRIELPAAAGKGRVLRSGLRDTEFPIMQAPAQQASLLLVQGNADNTYGQSSAIARLDPKRERLDRYEFGAHAVCEEHLWARDSKGREYALGTVFDSKKLATGLMLFDARKIADGPIAQAWLERAMPLGFHGTWVG